MSGDEGFRQQGTHAPFLGASLLEMEVAGLRHRKGPWPLGGSRLLLSVLLCPVMLAVLTS